MPPKKGTAIKAKSTNDIDKTNLDKSTPVVAVVNDFDDTDSEDGLKMDDMKGGASDGEEAEVEIEEQGDEEGDGEEGEEEEEDEEGDDDEGDEEEEEEEDGDKDGGDEEDDKDGDDEDNKKPKKKKAERDDKDSDGEDDGDDCMYDLLEVDDDDVYEEINTEKIRVKPEDRITKPFITKYERTRLKADRARQLALGAKPMIKNANGHNDLSKLTDRVKAEMEIKMKVIPLKIHRELPNGFVEEWKITEFLNI